MQLTGIQEGTNPAVVAVFARALTTFSQSKRIAPNFETCHVIGCRDDTSSTRGRLGTGPRRRVGRVGVLAPTGGDTRDAGS